MKKVIFLFLLSCSLILGAEVNQKNKVFTEKEAKSLLTDFERMTGESKENFDKFIKFSIKDDNWQKATNAFYLHTRNFKINKKQTAIPDWKEALKYYKKSVVESENVISAYQGMSLLNQFFMLFNTSKKATKIIKNEILDEYVPVFSSLLIKKGYCFGYAGLMNYESNYNLNTDKAITIGEQGLSICKKQLTEKKIPSWLEMNYRRDFVKLKAIKRLREK